MPIVLSHFYQINLICWIIVQEIKKQQLLM